MEQLKKREQMNLEIFDKKLREMQVNHEMKLKTLEGNYIRGISEMKQMMDSLIHNN